MARNSAKRSRLSDDDQIDATLSSGHDNVPGTFLTHPQLQQQPLGTSPYFVSQALPSYTGEADMDDYPSSHAQQKTRARGATRGRPRGSRGRPRGRPRGSGTMSDRVHADAGANAPSDAAFNGQHHDSADADEAPGREEAMDPLTFQCRGCFRLVGDTFSFVATDSELGYVVLSAVSEVVSQNPGYETSTDPGKDLGSTFAALVCAGCGATLGRNYRTTPRDLDNLRDSFSLDVDKIFTYQLGSNQTKQLESTDSDQKEIATKSIRLDQPAEGAAANVPQELEDKIEKTRMFAIKLSERLIKAEDDIRDHSSRIQHLYAAHSVESVGKEEPEAT